MASKANEHDEAFAKAAQEFDLEKLKSALEGVRGRKLPKSPWQYLQGVLSGFDLEEIARKCRLTKKSVEVTLTREVTPYIKRILNIAERERITWSRVPELLKREGYGFPQKQNKLDLDESQLAKIIEIIRGIDADKKLVVSSANLILFPPRLENWQGREQENEILKNWLTNDKNTTIGIYGLSGVGKSWLAAYVYESINSKPKFWADVRHGTDFSILAQNILTKIGGKSPEELIKLKEPELLIFALVDFLKQYPCLLVIDNLETLLDRNRHFIGSYRDFFNRWSEHGSGSTILLTTQAKPEVMDGHGCWHYLKGLDSDAGIQLLRKLGILGDDKSLRVFVEFIEGHPKMLRLVAAKLRKGTHIREADNLGLKQLDQLLNEVPMQYRDRERILFVWILEQHFNDLTPDLQTFFLNLGIYRRPFNREAATLAVKDIEPRFRFIPWNRINKVNQEFPDHSSKQDDIEEMKIIWRVGMLLSKKDKDKSLTKTVRWKTQQFLDELHSRSLLDLEKRGEQYYQLHSFVSQYVSQKASKYSHNLRERLIAYYLSNRKDENTWNSLEDVIPNIESVYHLCQIGQHSIAYEALSMCKEFLDLRGYYLTELELFEGLLNSWLPEEDEKSEFSSAMVELGGVYVHIGNFEKAVQLLQDGLFIQQQIGNSANEASTLGNLGLAYSGIGQYEQAIKCFEQQLLIAQKIGDRRLEANAINNIGTVYYILDLPLKSIEYQQKKIKILTDGEDISNLQDAANTLGNIGIAYCALGQYEKALECHHRQLKISKNIGYSSVEARALEGIGSVYLQLERYQEAIEYLRNGLDIAREINDRPFEATALVNLGKAYFFYTSIDSSNQKVKLAFDCLYQALEIAKQIGSYQAQSYALYTLGMAFLTMGNKAEAFKAYQSSLGIAQAIGLDAYVQKINMALQDISSN